MRSGRTLFLHGPSEAWYPLFLLFPLILAQLYSLYGNCKGLLGHLHVSAGQGRILDVAGGVPGEGHRGSQQAQGLSLKPQSNQWLPSSTVVQDPDIWNFFFDFKVEIPVSTKYCSWTNRISNFILFWSLVGCVQPSENALFKDRYGQMVYFHRFFNSWH